MPENYYFTLMQKEDIGDNIRSFYFEKPEGFIFKAGQYIKVFVDGRIDDDGGNSRFFTISSAPHEKYIVITTKMQPSQFKKHLYSLQRGDTIRVRGPYGSFVFADDTRSRVCISGGMGITPFRSMIVHLARKNSTQGLVLVAAFKNERESLFLQELEKISESFPSFQIYPLFSQPERNDIKVGKGRIDALILKKYIANLMGSVYYITGPSEMVESVVDILHDFGIPETDIFIEKFPGYSYE